jgi:hypothetical protein
VCTRLGIVQRDFREALDGGGGVDPAVGSEDAAVVVGGVRAETDVADDVQVGEEGFQFMDRLDNAAGWIVGFETAGILKGGGVSA